MGSSIRKDFVMNKITRITIVTGLFLVAATLVRTAQWERGERTEVVARETTTLQSGPRESTRLGAYTIPLLPTMDLDQYARLKEAAQRTLRAPSPASPIGPSSPVQLQNSFPGLDRNGSQDLGFVFTPP